MKLRSRYLALLGALALSIVTAQTAVAADQNTLTPAELNDGWILLFDGASMFGWEVGSKATWKVIDGTLTAVEGEKGLLATTSEFADYELKVDFKPGEKTNSGVFLRTLLQPTSAAVNCYELNIGTEEVTPYFTGSFVDRVKAKPYTFHEGWHTFEVKAEGAHFVVKLDGKEVLDYTDPKPIPRGRIGLQINQGPIAFRNVKLRPLSLKPIFNGKDLSGWKVHSDKKSVFSVTPEGALNVKNGAGQIESEGQYGDFVLQLDIFSNGKFLNSGIFFRNMPGGHWQGYESQIQNGFLADRALPMDFGTGGIYRRQKARKVVPNDFEWFHKTLVVSGPHMAVWVNGYQVSDFTDTRPANENARDGLRLKAGTLAIQGHDPTTDLSFRNIRITETKPFVAPAE